MKRAEGYIERRALDEAAEDEEFLEFLINALPPEFFEELE